VTRRRGRRSKKLLDGFKEKKGYWKLKVETPDCTVGITRFGRVCGIVARQTAE
jgi:hypothetical protein